MIDHLFNIFVIAIVVMTILGGFVFISEKILSKFPNIKEQLTNLFSDESENY